MATISAIHAAAATKQIGTITVANTWTATDTAICTMNGKALTVTIGADTSTTQVATAIRDAWNATSRLDSEGATDATSNFGGQEFGEFAEVTASIDPDSPSVVLLTANRSGVPFTVTVTESTISTGTATGATSQAATGPWHWDNGKNWSGGSVPANDDITVLQNQSGANVGFKYGLPNASLEVTIQHWMSYTGQIGLPPINSENASKPYYEYRQRYVRLDDAGTGTDIQHRFGLGKDGTGSPLMFIKHVTVKCTPVVYNTGTPQILGLKALNICCTTNTSTLNVLGGSVDCSSQDGSTSALIALTQSGGDVRSVIGTAAATTIKSSGGTMLLGGTAGIALLTSLSNGKVVLQGQSGTIDGILILENGIVENESSTMTITAMTIFAGGLFDLRGNAGTYTLTNCTILRGGRFLDPYRRTSTTNPIQLLFDPSPDLVLGASSVNPISFDN